MVETSVIIPTFNRRELLQEAIHSVLEQTYRNFELIIVDDGSNDGTRDLVTSLSNTIKYIYQENQGPAAARNRGIQKARGQFVTFLDSDDLWLKDKLKVQIEFMKSNPEALVCYTDEIWIRRGVRVNPKKKHQKHSGWIFSYCLPLCIVSPSSVLMRREFFNLAGYFDEQLPACEDYDLWLRASLKMPFYFIPQKLIIKRGGHPDQLSAQWGLDRYRVKALLKLLENENLTPEQKYLVIEKIKEKCKILEQGFRKHGNEKEAIYYQQIRLRYESTL